MNIQQHQLIKEMSNVIGKEIPLMQGAAVVTLDDEEIYLEFPEQSMIYIIHQKICLMSSLGANYQQLEAALTLNSRLDVLRCGWLGFHKATNSLRYFVTVPVQIACVDLLLKTLKSLQPIKKHIIASLKI